MSTSELAGQPAPLELLTNIPRLVAAYYTHKPDPEASGQVSWHPGTAAALLTVNLTKIIFWPSVRHLNCANARASTVRSTWAWIPTLFPAAHATAIEVFAANEVQLVIAAGLEYTPTPVISHAILTYNAGRSSGLADGVVITPSHNPPPDGGFKYNPPLLAPPTPKRRRLSGSRQRNHG
ncbi:MAG: hypothetical protein R2867_29605 [Caldilineaceae bacterium]